MPKKKWCRFDILNRIPSAKGTTFRKRIAWSHSERANFSKKKKNCVLASVYFINDVSFADSGMCVAAMFINNPACVRMPLTMYTKRWLIVYLWCNLFARQPNISSFDNWIGMMRAHKHNPIHCFFFTECKLIRINSNCGKAFLMQKKKNIFPNKQANC